MLFSILRLSTHARAYKLLYKRFADHPQFFVPFVGIPVFRLYVDRLSKSKPIGKLNLAVNTAVSLARRFLLTFQASAVLTGILF